MTFQSGGKPYEDEKRGKPEDDDSPEYRKASNRVVCWMGDMANRTISERECPEELQHIHDDPSHPGYWAQTEVKPRNNPQKLLDFRLEIMRVFEQMLPARLKGNLELAILGRQRVQDYHMDRLQREPSDEAREEYGQHEVFLGWLKSIREMNGIDREKQERWKKRLEAEEPKAQEPLLKELFIKHEPSKPVASPASPTGPAGSQVVNTPNCLDSDYRDALLLGLKSPYIFYL